jgi:naphthalene 1,2-dioxygenase system ferredoxin subunit
MSEQWLAVIPFDALPEGDVTGVEANGDELALYRVEGAVYATDNVCTHGQARLCDGFLEGYEIECPMHQGRFDVRDGRPLCPPAAVPIRCHPVKVVDGIVHVAFASGTTGQESKG